MKYPELVVVLANARSVRRPTGARERAQHDALADVTAASELLSGFVGRPLGSRELPAVRELHLAVVAIVDALIDGAPPRVEKLNRIAARSAAVRELELRPDGTLRVVVRFPHRSAAAILADRAVSELAGLDPLRLRRCGRRECQLVFYDRTRSNTQRWHAERPCGLRERQRRHRAKTTGRAARPGTATPRRSPSNREAEDTR